jgi:hypothetical protein
VLQESQPEPELTARECLTLYAGYYADPLPVADTLAKVGLIEAADRRCRRRRRIPFCIDQTSWDWGRTASQD